MTSLYRHFDADGDLLYVGVSLSAVYRLSQHKQASGWYSDISRVDIENFTSRTAALIAETAAIQGEDPKYNIQKKAPKLPKTVEVYKNPEMSRMQLLHRVAIYQPIYTMDEAGRALRQSASAVKRLVEDGKLGCIITGRSMRKTKDGVLKEYVKRKITGWQLIEYIEHLESQRHD